MELKKNHALIIISVLIVSIVLAGIIQPGVAQAQPVEEQDYPNKVYLEVTYDPDTETYSIGGFSAAQLKEFGAPKLPSGVWNVLSRFEEVTLMMNNEAISLSTEGERLADIQWDKSTRQSLYAFVSEYVSITNASAGRIEEWAGNTMIVMNFRNSSSIAKPLQVQLSTLLQVDIDSDKLLVEGFDTGVNLDPLIASTAKTGGIENTTVCWYKGQLIAYANGKELPVITIYQDGLNIVNEALELGLGYLPPYFEAQIGADVSFDGAEHSGIYCESK